MSIFKKNKKKKFADAVNLNLDHHTRILVVVDVQEGFIHKSSKDLPEKITIFAEKMSFDCVIRCLWVNDVNSNFYKKLNYRDMCSENEVRSCLPKLGEEVLMRTAYSCCTAQFLDIVQETDDVYICGLETDACILASGFDLFNRNYNFTIVSDLVMSKNLKLHQAALDIMKRNFGKQSVATTTDIYEMCRVGEEEVEE